MGNFRFSRGAPLTQRADGARFAAHAPERAVVIALTSTRLLPDFFFNNADEATVEHERAPCKRLRLDVAGVHHSVHLVRRATEQLANVPNPLGARALSDTCVPKLRRDPCLRDCESASAITAQNDARP